MPPILGVCEAPALASDQKVALHKMVLEFDFRWGRSDKYQNKFFLAGTTCSEYYIFWGPAPLVKIQLPIFFFKPQPWGFQKLVTPQKDKNSKITSERFFACLLAVVAPIFYVATQKKGNWHDDKKLFSYRSQRTI